MRSPLHQPAGDEHDVRVNHFAQPVENLPDALLGDAGVLVVAEHLLQLRGGRQLAHRASLWRGAQRWLDELARVADALDADPQVVQHLVRGVGARLPHGAAQPAELRSGSCASSGCACVADGVGNGRRIASARRSSSAA